jgi:hypothetical protein
VTAKRFLSHLHGEMPRWHRARNAQVDAAIPTAAVTVTSSSPSATKSSPISALK